MISKRIAFILISGMVIISLCSCSKKSTADDLKERTVTITETSSDTADDSVEPEKKEEASEITLGELNGNLYTNASLGIRMEIPDGWYSHSDEERLAMVQAGMETYAGDDKLKQVQADFAMHNTLTLVYSSEKNPLEAAGANASITLIAEKLTALNSVFLKSSEDYITAVKTQLAEVKDIGGIAVSYEFDETKEITINQNVFSVLAARLTLDDQTVILNQDNYAYYDKERGYIYFATLSYASDEQRQVMETSINTLTIE